MPTTIPGSSTLTVCVTKLHVALQYPSNGLGDAIVMTMLRLESVWVNTNRILQWCHLLHHLEAFQCTDESILLNHYFLAQLAYMPMRLSNFHEVSPYVCHRHCYWLSIVCSHCCCHTGVVVMCTAVPVTLVLTETLYLADTSTYIPNICTWNIWRNVTCTFEMPATFYLFINMALLTYLVKLRSYRFGSVMYLYLSYPQEKIMHLQIIFLKLWFFKKNYILHF